MAVGKIKKVAKKPLTAIEKVQITHIRENRKVFNDCGFKRVIGVDGKDVVFGAHKGELDDVFVYKNVVLIAEYTCISTGRISAHLKKKAHLFTQIMENQAASFKVIKDCFPSVKALVDASYHEDDIVIRIFYSSKNKIEQEHKGQISNIVYFDYPILKYFQSVTNAIKRSAVNEILAFSGVDFEDIGAKSQPLGNIVVKGYVLPEKHSKFPAGFKVVSFYIEPIELLSRSYVLRQHGWEDSQFLYQRMISKGKISAIRKHLVDSERVFINNVIVTLSSDTKLLDKDLNTIKMEEITKTSDTSIQISNRFNSIGIIDGQHRIFSYFEGEPHESKIAKLRNRQTLLVTGIIYPNGYSKFKKIKFEAELFLEINSNQTNAKSDLKHAIKLLLDPYSAVSIGKRVLNQLNKQGPLNDKFEVYFYESNKVKTTSIVSYGLVPLIRLEGDESLYKLWDNPNKKEIEKKSNSGLLEDYIDYCSAQINCFIAAVKNNVEKCKWTSDKKIKGRLLTTTHLNGFIICLRLIVESNQLGDFEAYDVKLNNLGDFDFAAYHSSQYGQLGRDMYEAFFNSVTV